MKGIGWGESLKGGISYGRGNFQTDGNSGATSQPQVQSIRITKTILEIGQPSNPNIQGPISTNNVQRLAPETQSSRLHEEIEHPSPESENGTC